MKSLVCLFVLFASTATAQPDNRVSLQLGSATVWLGMDKAAAKRNIEAAGIVFSDKLDSGGSGIAVDPRSKQIFTLKFENDRLVFADRDWLRESDVLPSIVDALTSLIDQGASQCTVTHSPMSAPDKKVNRVLIDCGDRGLLLTYGTEGNFTTNMVSERIGRY